MTIDASNVNDVGAGSTFYVYGVGDGSVSASSNSTEISSARTRSAVNYFSFTVDAAQAESIRENGITFSGDNFLIYKVTISKQTYTAPSGGSNQIWPDTPTNPAPSISIEGSKFNNITTSNKVCIYGTRTANYFNFALRTANWSAFSPVTNWTINDKWLYATENAYNSTDNCFVLQVTTELIPLLKEGITIESYNTFNISHVDIE